MKVNIAFKLIAFHQAGANSVNSTNKRKIAHNYSTSTLKINQVFICLASFVAVASASHLIGAPAAIPAAVNTGSSSQYRSQDNLGQYSFGYDEAGATGGSFRQEKSDALGNRVGSYGLTGADGRVRIVNYVADANGYRANVQTNEPGTESRDTAGVAMNKALAVGK